MWAHYADQFYGMCVAYHFLALRDSLPNDTTFARVMYSEEIPKTTATYGMLSFSERAKEILSTKNQRWAYEREWRMFGRPERNDYRQRRFQVVAKVYVGSRVNSDWLEYIEAQLTPARIPVEKIGIDDYAIKLESPSVRLLPTVAANSIRKARTARSKAREFD
jgi:hypothetical protein